MLPGDKYSNNGRHAEDCGDPDIDKPVFQITDCASGTGHSDDKQRISDGDSGIYSEKVDQCRDR